MHDSNGIEMLAFFRVQNLDFSHSVFIEANLTNVLFENCNFRGASFRKANCTNTTFHGCDLFRTIFAESSNLYPVQLFRSFHRTETLFESPERYHSMIKGFVDLRHKIEKEKKPRRIDFSKTYKKLLDKLAGQPRIIGPSVFVDICQAGDSFKSTKTRLDIFQQSFQKSSYVERKDSQESDPEFFTHTPMPSPEILASATDIAKQAQSAFERKGQIKYRQKELSKIHHELKKMPNNHGSEVGG